MLSEYEKAGVKLDKYIESGQFEIRTADETYLLENNFDQDRMINLIKEVEEQALKDGYEGVRGVGEMTWILRDKLDIEKLIKYEAFLDDFMANKKISLLCQYNENKTDKKLLNNVIRSHKQVIIHGKLYENKYFFVDSKQLEIDGDIYYRRTHTGQ